MRTVSQPFQPGDRVVDLAIEMVYEHKYFGTVVGVKRNIVTVHWDVDSTHWHDTMYVDELRFATREEDNATE